MVSMGDGVGEGVWLGGVVEMVEGVGCEGAVRWSRLVALTSWRLGPLP